MSVCSATAAASSYSRARKGRSASTTQASVTDQLIQKNDQGYLSQNRTGTGRPSISEHLMDLTDRSRRMSTPKGSTSHGCCVISLLAVLTLITLFFAG